MLYIYISVKRCELLIERALYKCLLLLFLYYYYYYYTQGLIHSDSARSDDCRRAFHGELRLSSFPWELPRYALPASVKGICKVSCNLPPALSAEWRQSLMCYCGIMGWNGHRYNSEYKEFQQNKSPTACTDRTCEAPITNPAICLLNYIPAPWSGQGETNSQS